jgi:hypothetical protein
MSRPDLKEVNMKKIWGIALALCLVAGLVYAKDYEVTKKAGAYEVTISMEKNPPVVGNNVMSVSIRDAYGKAVSDAKVSVNYGMPAMPGMPAVNYKAGAEQKGGKYEAGLNFSMSGAWSVQVKITRGGQTVTARLTVDVR